MKNRLVVIGTTGIKKAYLNVPRAVAIERFLAEDEIMTGPSDVNTDDYRFYISRSVKEFEFNDCFGVYDAWAEDDER